MASHTFCRARTISQKSCSAADALIVVQDILKNGSLADDLRANLSNVAAQLQVLKELPQDTNRGGAPDRREPAATTPAAAGKAPGSAAPSDKKEEKHGTKQKDAKDGVQSLTDGKKAKDKSAEKDTSATKEDKKRKEGGRDKERKERKERKKEREGKAGARGEGKKENEDRSRKRPAEQTEEGEKDTVQKPKRQKTKA